MNSMIPQRAELQLSVIIPAHNCLPFLKRSVHNVMDQWTPQTELIVVDDGSDDGTWEWLENMVEKYSRIRSIRLDGRGPGFARNSALAHCRGTWVAFLDADDIWYPEKLENQLIFHRNNPDVILSFTNYRHVNMEGKDLGDCYGYWPRFGEFAAGQHGYFDLGFRGAAMIFAENIIGTSTVMVRRDALQDANGFDSSLHSAQDWDLWLRLAMMGRIVCSNRVDTEYVMRSGSVSAKTSLRLKNLGLIIGRYQEEISRVDPGAIWIAKGRLAVGYGEYYLGTGQPWRALLAHLKGWLMAPSKRVGRAVLADGWMALKGIVPG